MKEKNKIKDKLGMLLLLLTIVTFNIIIGANEKGLRVLPISILMAFIIAYLIIVKIKSKNKSIIFKSKIDYFVLLFMLSTTLPLIFGTYASYSDTIEFIMKYFFIYSVYLLARNVIQDKKQIECVIVITLVSSIIQVLLHIDYTHWQILKDFMKWIDITYSASKEFCGTFGYANAQAIYMALCIFLAMHRFKVNKKKVLKVLDIIYIFGALYIVYIAESKIVLLLIILTLFILGIVKFRKHIVKHKRKIIIGVFGLLFFSINYVSMGLKASKTIIATDEDINQIIKYNFKQNEKYTLELELETIYNGELEAFKDTSFIIKAYDFGKYFMGKELYSKTIGETNGKYIIDLNPGRDTNLITLKIKNKYKGTIKLGKCFINGKEHIINYKYITNDLAYMLNGHNIGKKSLPQRIQMYKDCTKMVKDSPIIGLGGNVWKDLSSAYAEYRGALKECHSYFFELLISYGIIGFITFFIFVIYFFMKLFKQLKINRENVKNKLLIAIGVFILLLHTLVDFDMSFILIQLMVYIYIASLQYDNLEIDTPLTNNNEKDILNTENILNKTIIKNISDCGIIVFLVFILSLYIRADVSKYILTNKEEQHNMSPYNKTYYGEMIDEDIKNNKNEIDVLNKLKDFMKKEPYYKQNENYEKYFNLIYRNIDNLSNEELKENLELGIERLKHVKVKKIMYFDFVIKRTEILANTIKNFEEYIAKSENIQNSSEEIGNIIITNEKCKLLNNSIQQFKNIINNEYNTNINNLEDFDRNGYADIEKNNYRKRYQEIIELLQK